MEIASGNGWEKRKKKNVAAGGSPTESFLSETTMCDLWLDGDRPAQQKVCAETGAVYIDTFAAALGEPDDVHPCDKRPFADLAARFGND